MATRKRTNSAAMDKTSQPGFADLLQMVNTYGLVVELAGCWLGWSRQQQVFLSLEWLVRCSLVFLKYNINIAVKNV
ncbi:hypothetical protein CDAR_302341 [Caerostris darwini]|uniref:Uncharacterized protein n=1 Tax=Caerostris darwini TaxID=1538125 RepID=A0AAV4UET1_9ARAC|nr:hypothetical protein CDAR_302341 [Caerostris darwini]